MAGYATINQNFTQPIETESAPRALWSGCREKQSKFGQLVTVQCSDLLISSCGSLLFQPFRSAMTKAESFKNTVSETPLPHTMEVQLSSRWHGSKKIWWWKTQHFIWYFGCFDLTTPTRSPNMEVFPLAMFGKVPKRQDVHTFLLLWVLAVLSKGSARILRTFVWISTPRRCTGWWSANVHCLRLWLYDPCPIRAQIINTISGKIVQAVSSALVSRTQVHTFHENVWDRRLKGTGTSWLHSAWCSVRFTDCLSVLQFRDILWFSVSTNLPLSEWLYFSCKPNCNEMASTPTAMYRRANTHLLSFWQAKKLSSMTFRDWNTDENREVPLLRFLVIQAMEINTVFLSRPVFKRQSLDRSSCGVRICVLPQRQPAPPTETLVKRNNTHSYTLTQSLVDTHSFTHTDTNTDTHSSCIWCERTLRIQSNRPQVEAVWTLVALWLFEHWNHRAQPDRPCTHDVWEYGAEKSTKVLVSDAESSGCSSPTKNSSRFSLASWQWKTKCSAARNEISDSVHVSDPNPVRISSWSKEQTRLNRTLKAEMHDSLDQNKSIVALDSDQRARIQLVGVRSVELTGRHSVLSQLRLWSPGKVSGARCFTCKTWNTRKFSCGFTNKEHVLHLSERVCVCGGGRICSKESLGNCTHENPSDELSVHWKMQTMHPTHFRVHCDPIQATGSICTKQFLGPDLNLSGWSVYIWCSSVCRPNYRATVKVLNDHILRSVAISAEWKTSNKRVLGEMLMIAGRSSLRQPTGRSTNRKRKIGSHKNYNLSALMFCQAFSQNGAKSFRKRIVAQK